MMTLKGPCNFTYHAANHSGPRDTSKLKWVVIHSAESTNAAGVAVYFSRESTEASTHLAVDDTSCFRMLADSITPWGASGANYNGLHIEICGYARWTLKEWMTHAMMLNRAAYRTAVWCNRYNIPPRWVGPIGLRLGRKGITTHVDVNKAFKKGSHWDPGPNFPKEWFLGRVKAYLKEIKENET